MRKLYKSRYNKAFAGVCGGIGTYLRWDPNLIRLLYVFFMCLTAFLPLLIAYIILALIMPLEPKGSPAMDYKKVYRPTSQKCFSGLCAGLANFFKVDVTLFRIIWIVLLFCSLIYPLIVTYIVGTILIPEKQTPR